MEILDLYKTNNERPVFLVFCQPETGLHKKYPSVVTSPQTGEVNLGILYIAALLEKRGFNVKVLDNTIEKLSKSNLVNKLASANPLLVGFSVTCLNVKNFRETAKDFKNICPQIPVVVGGPHVTLLPEKFIELPYVDYLVKGEGEISLCELAENVKAGANSPGKSPEDKLIIGRHASSLDSLPFPARHLVDLNRYRTKSYVMDIEPIHFVCSSRGCPFGCTFCSSKGVWGRHYYRRDPEKVVDEIEFLMNDYGAKGIYFREDNFTVDKNHVLGICSEIRKRGLEIAWECESRVDSLDKPTLAVMKAAGCAGIWSGVESGSQRILDNVCKGITVDQIYRFFGWCRELGISSGACFMLGFPGETAEDMRATFDLAISLPVKWASFATYFGFPRSELYEEIINKSLYEATWEDIYITRNEYFSSSQLYALEAAMNRDAKLILMERDRSTGHDKRLSIKNLAIVVKNVCSRKRPSFYELLDRYAV